MTNGYWSHVPSTQFCVRMFQLTIFYTVLHEKPCGEVQKLVPEGGGEEE